MAPAATKQPRPTAASGDTTRSRMHHGRQAFMAPCAGFLLPSCIADQWRCERLKDPSASRRQPAASPPPAPVRRGNARDHGRTRRSARAPRTGAPHLPPREHARPRRTAAAAPVLLPQRAWEGGRVGAGTTEGLSVGIGFFEDGGIERQARQKLGDTRTGSAIPVSIVTRPPAVRDRCTCRAARYRVTASVLHIGHVGIAFAQPLPVAHIHHRRAKRRRLNDAGRRIAHHHSAVAHRGAKNWAGQVLSPGESRAVKVIH
jgi:hypothetical protein